MIRTDDLWALLPAVHRLRDAAAAGDVTGTRGALRGLVAVLASEADVLDADIERLGDAWFIETCAPWLVPYIGDLLGVRPLHPIGAGSRRAYVANAVAYRRRKGTAAVLEQLADDVTGWRTSAVEYFTRLATTQHSRHVRPDNVRTVRSPHVADLADGPFDTVPRTGEVRRIATRGGRFNLPVVGLHAWRCQPYPMHHAEARRVAPARWTFDPLGRDVPLFNPAAGTAERHSRAAEHELPGPLRRLALRDELGALRHGQARTPVWFGAGAPVLSVARRLPGGGLEPIPPEQLLVADLALWQRPPAAVNLPDGGAAAPIAAAVDPERGRLTFPASAEPVEVRVGYAYGAPGDLGGGPYDRRDRFDATYRDRVGWRAVVSRSWDESPAPAYRLLRDAVLAWNAQLAGPDPVPVGEIVIADSGIHLLERPPFEGIPDPRGLTGRAAVRLRPGCELRIVAAQTNELPPDATHAPAFGERLVPAGVRPVLAGNVSVLSRGGGLAGAGRLVLDGLWIAGQVTVRAGNLAELRLTDCTVAPPSGIGVNVSGVNPQRRNTALAVVLERTITGPLDLQRAAAVRTREGVIDAVGGAAVAAPEADCTIDDSTVLGASTVRSVDASNSIFTGPVAVERRQAGCMRYCALPATPPSVTPRRFRCQPDLAAAAASDPAARSPDPDAEVARSRVAPSFVSLSFGRPGYTQLAARCAPELGAGGEDGTEMGVWRHLREPQRRANLATGLDEYLRAGLEAGPLYVT